jgi:hypothetical protein
VRVPREAAVHLLHNGGYVVHDFGIAPTPNHDGPRW